MEKRALTISVIEVMLIATCLMRPFAPTMAVISSNLDPLDSAASADFKSRKGKPNKKSGSAKSPIQAIAGLLTNLPFLAPERVYAASGSAAYTFTPQVASDAAGLDESTPIFNNMNLQEILGASNSGDLLNSLITHRNDYPAQSAVLRGRKFVDQLTKKDYEGGDRVQIVVKNADYGHVAVTLKRGNNLVTLPVTKTVANGQTVFTLHPSTNFQPGKYTVTVTDTNTNAILSTQDFTWGVLAINSDKSIYLPGQKADIAMAVLDEKGRMVCNASVQLIITDPHGTQEQLSTDDGSIAISPDCKVHGITSRPDYEAFYTTGSIGNYSMQLTATDKNGSFKTSDGFVVEDKVPFDVTRQTATRIYPKDSYPVILHITANQDFQGEIVESVPQVFTVAPVTHNGNETVEPFTSQSALPDGLSETNQYGIPQLSLPFNSSYDAVTPFGQPVSDSAENATLEKYGITGNDGIDFAMPEGTKILSADEGVVVLAQNNWLYGATVVIKHSWGQSYYGHLSKLEVRVGEHVEKGIEIGLSGSTGTNNFESLYFAIKPTGANTDNLYFGKIDPAPFLGIATTDSSLATANYPYHAKALIWNVSLHKGDHLTIGYTYKAPNTSPDFYTIGPLQFIGDLNNSLSQAGDVLSTSLASTSAYTNDGVLRASNSAQLIADATGQQIANPTVIFQENRRWQIAADDTFDIVVQRNTADIGVSGATETAPSDFTAFSSLNSAFVRNLSNRYTSGGPETSTSNMNADDMSGTVSLTATDTISFDRQSGSINANNQFSWESWEYVGDAGGPNEFIVRSRNTVTLSGAESTTATLDTAPDNIDHCIPFITGIKSSINSTGADTLTAVAWISGTNTLNVIRGAGTSGTVVVQVTTVEFTGSNWHVAHGLSTGDSADSGTITLVDNADGQTAGGGDISDWSHAVIFHQQKANSSGVDDGIDDNSATYKPGATTSEVDWHFNTGHVSSVANEEHMVHVLENPDMTVTRYEDKGSLQDDNNVDISSAGLTDLAESASDLTCDSSGTGTAYGRGWANGRITSLTNFSHWAHRSGNTIDCQIQIMDLSGLVSTSGSATPTLDQLLRHGQWFNSSGAVQPFTF